MTSTNYDPIAPTYHDRYRANPMPGIAACLRGQVQDSSPGRLLEVGCGTGRWLGELNGRVPQVFGIDLSPGMLQKAKEMDYGYRLACAQAAELPFPGRSFDLVLCVNALHHFPDGKRFTGEAARVLRPGGRLVVIGMDPQRGRDRWYLYDYFEGALQADLDRYPSAGRVLDWMASCGFAQAQWGLAEHISHRWEGAGVLTDPFLKKHSTSQLIRLTQEAYERGMERLRAGLRQASVQGQAIAFQVDIELVYIFGILGEPRRAQP